MLSTKDLALDYDEDGQNDDHDDSTGVSRRDNEIKQFDSNSPPIKIITIMLTLDIMINFPLSLVSTAREYRIV